MARNNRNRWKTNQWCQQKVSRLSKGCDMISKAHRMMERPTFLPQRTCSEVEEETRHRVPGTHSVRSWWIHSATQRDQPVLHAGRAASQKSWIIDSLDFPTPIHFTEAKMENIIRIHFNLLHICKYASQNPYRAHPSVSQCREHNF